MGLYTLRLNVDSARSEDRRSRRRNFIWRKPRLVRGRQHGPYGWPRRPPLCWCGMGVHARRLDVDAGGKAHGRRGEGQSWIGGSVALDSDGNTALVTGGGDNHAHGAAWVFTRSGSTWTQQGEKLTGSGEVISPIAGPFFGSSAALSSDGDTALIGGRSDNNGNGAAWVFTRLGSTWTQQGEKLTGGGEVPMPFVDFGDSVALSADGSTALIGGNADDENVGAAWVFTRFGSTWTQQGEKFTRGDSFGLTVALSSDAQTAFIATPSGAWAFVNTSPIVTNVDPQFGLPAGGTSVTISGRNFTGATAVKFGSTDAASFEVNSENAITAIAPAGTGTVDVTVTTPEGTSTSSTADQFIYSAVPTLTKVSPGKGPATGDTTVTITGSNFIGATAVLFGSNDATSFTVNSATKITAVSPAEPAGKVDVTVTTLGGTSAIVSKDHYSFTPTVTGPSPNTGSTTGGTSMTISGTGFALGTTATSFQFGKTKATSVNCTSTTECTVVSPAHEAGIVDVHAVVNKVASPKNAPADQFTYE